MIWDMWQTESLIRNIAMVVSCRRPVLNLWFRIFKGMFLMRLSNLHSKCSMSYMDLFYHVGVGCLKVGYLKWIWLLCCHHSGITIGWESSWALRSYWGCTWGNFMVTSSQDIESQLCPLMTGTGTRKCPSTKDPLFAWYPFQFLSPAIKQFPQTFGKPICKSGYQSWSLALQWPRLFIDHPIENTGLILHGCAQLLNQLRYGSEARGHCVDLGSHSWKIEHSW